MILHTVVLLLISLTVVHSAAAAPPAYLWFEPEWFPGVEGHFAYWPAPAKASGKWGVAGPGISPEWTQGGESEWNSIGAAAEETAAQCHRDFIIPRQGKYKIWVRYVDHRQKTEPFEVAIDQQGRSIAASEIGATAVVPAGDEYALYWGFSFGWHGFAAELPAGPSRLTLKINKPAEAWRQVDALLITDDLSYTPIGREKPPFDYHASFDLAPPRPSHWRGIGDFKVGASWKRSTLGGRDFSMWTPMETDADWWKSQTAPLLYDVFFRFSPPADIREKFHQQFAGRRDLPIISFGGLLPGVYLGTTPDLSAAGAVRPWLEQSKTPFYILTNYANPQYSDQTGPATYEALSTTLAEQFLGYIHGEAVGTSGVSPGAAPLAATRREHVDAWSKKLVADQTAAWSKIYKTHVSEKHVAKSISCLSVDSTALAHLFHEMGAQTVGYEVDSTNVHVPMRIAFERGAARQYGGNWIHYASGNFGDACNYFTQNPVVPRGAPGWFHSKYAITDGVTATWYRKLYYLNYLSGASAVFWEQGLGNQWMLPGPGTHPIGLSPFGRATADFQAFASRLPDRGEPLTPVAFLLNYGHAYDRVSYDCKMLGFPETSADLELRELFNVCWHPSGVIEGLPAAPDVQSLPGGVYGNIFDVLVDRPGRAEAIFNYPVVWAAGDVELGGGWTATLQEYLRRGGTLIVNIEAARKLPAELIGLAPTGKNQIVDVWTPDDGRPRACVPYELAGVELKGAEPIVRATQELPLVTRHRVGPGAVLVTLAPHMLGHDERAHPALPYLMNGLTADLMPVEVRRADGQRLDGEVLYQINRTAEGYLVALLSTRGIDKTPSGVARVDRRAVANIIIRSKQPLKSVMEYTAPRDLTAEQDAGGRSVIRLAIPAGEIQVVALRVQ
jgi:hypothetical protein